MMLKAYHPCPAITPTAQGSRYQIIKRAPGPHPRRVLSFKRMAGDCHQGLPSSRQEGEEGQGQGHSPPRKGSREH